MVRLSGVSERREASEQWLYFNSFPRSMARIVPRSRKVFWKSGMFTTKTRSLPSSHLDSTCASSIHFAIFSGLVRAPHTSAGDAQIAREFITITSVHISVFYEEVASVKLWFLSFVHRVLLLVVIPAQAVLHGSLPLSVGIGTKASALFQCLSPPGKLIEHCASCLLLSRRIAQSAGFIEVFPGHGKTDRIANRDRV
jgi:hypothetical protein